jgi:predicted MFS family arabinose efflux permease
MNTDLQTQSILNSKRTFTSFCTLGLAGVFIFSILPLLIGTIASELSLTPIQSGTIISVYYAGYSLIAITSFIWFNRIIWKKSVRIGYFLALLSIVAIIFMNDYKGILVSMVFLGFSGALFFAISMGIVAKTEKVDQNYAFKMVPEQLVPSLFVIIIPLFVIGDYGLNGLLISVMVLYAILLLFTSWVPSNRVENVKTDFRKLLKSKSALMALFGLLISFSGFLGLWGFVEIIAREYNISPDNSSVLLALSLLTSAIAPFMSGLVSERFGRLKPILFSLVVATISFSLLFLEPSIYSFGTFVLILIASYFFALPYMFASIAKADITGELSVLSSAALAIGSMLGAYFFGVLMEFSGINSAYMFSFTTIVFGMILILKVEKTHS